MRQYDRTRYLTLSPLSNYLKYEDVIHGVRNPYCQCAPTFLATLFNLLIIYHLSIKYPRDPWLTWVSYHFSWKIIHPSIPLYPLYLTLRSRQMFERTANCELRTANCIFICLASDFFPGFLSYIKLELELGAKAKTKALGCDAIMGCPFIHPSSISEICFSPSNRQFSIIEDSPSFTISLFRAKNLQIIAFVAKKKFRRRRHISDSGRGNFGWVGQRSQQLLTTHPSPYLRPHVRQWQVETAWGELWPLSSSDDLTVTWRLPAPDSQRVTEDRRLSPCGRNSTFPSSEKMHLTGHM